ncbi:hypothetical protein MAR_036339 [Mya arenaria]|uniref:Uncharacterized protein n=1 Tax=Mya arenaria TaxID=6604 RepID=A0ABY7EMP5_MYAAR|nr:hypothetical protein MAR_036339 [Mya arenaria]
MIFTGCCWCADSPLSPQFYSPVVLTGKELFMKYIMQFEPASISHLEVKEQLIFKPNVGPITSVWKAQIPFRIPVLRYPD